MPNRFINYIAVIARRANQYNEIPIGSIITKDGIIITQHYNITKQKKNIFHAEILCINDATFYLNSHNLKIAYMYSSIQPCNMCIQAIALSKIRKVYFSIYNRKFGGIKDINQDIKIELKNKTNRSIKILRYFFRKRNDKNKSEKYNI